MAEAFMVKRIGPVLTPLSGEDAAVLDKIKLGAPVKIKFTRVRNLKFHRKWFALARFAYDYWELPELQDEKYKNIEVEKNFDRFRKDLTIRAGFYEATYRLDGSVRIEAKSIAFDKMDEDEFEKLFSKTVDVVIKEVCTNMTDNELRTAVDQALAFVS